MKKILEKFGYRPRFAVWELTLACNMCCGHCGSRAGQARANELSPDEALQVVAQLCELGLERLTLSGGEPTMRLDWPDIARAIKEGGALANLISNGWEWSDETTRTAVEADLANVCFSVDGLEETHDQIRRKGSFSRVMQAFDSCAAHGLPTASVMTLNRKNLHQLDAVHDLLLQRGVTIWQLQVSDLMGNMRDNIEWAFHPEDLLDVEAKIATLIDRSDMRIAVGDNVGFYGPHEDKLRSDTPFGFWVGCFAGCQVIGIEADGNVKGCLSQQDPAFVEGNLRERPLREIWNRPGAFAYNREFSIDQLEGFCRDCRYAEICRGGCTCTAHFASGSKFDNPYCLHRTAELRAQGIVEPVGTERDLDAALLKTDATKSPCHPVAR